MRNRNVRIAASVLILVSLLVQCAPATAQSLQRRPRAPRVVVEAPSTAAGTVEINVTATGKRIASVELYLDNVLVGSFSTANVTYTWDSTAVENGTHTFRAKATDSAGRIGRSARVTVTVENAPPAPQAEPSLGTPEALVAGLYRELLGREPDAEGFAYWVEWLKYGGSYDHLRETFLSSEEYQQRQRVASTPPPSSDPPSGTPNAEPPASPPPAPPETEPAPPPAPPVATEPPSPPPPAPIPPPPAGGQPPVAADEILVDFSSYLGPPTYRASGFLLGMSSTQPPDNEVLPLKPQLFRDQGDGGLRNHERVLRVRARHHQIMMNSTFQAPWPGDGGDWTAWYNRIDSLVLPAKANGWTIEWDLWNEPDGGFFWGRSEAQFFETWQRGVQRIRSIDPNAIIVGPSVAWHGAGSMIKPFLIFARDNNVLPDVLSWHDGDASRHGRNVPGDVQDFKTFMAQNGINIQRFSINESINIGVNQLGSIVSHMANFERAGIESSARYCWSTLDCGGQNLDGYRNWTPEWWVYKAYADITGNLVAVTPTDTADAVAGYDPQLGEARVLVGTVGPTGTLKLRFSNMHAVSYLGSTVRVVVDKIGVGYQKIIDASVPVIDNQLMLTIDSVNTLDAYQITLRPR